MNYFIRYIHIVIEGIFVHLASCGFKREESIVYNLHPLYKTPVFNKRKL